MVTPLTKQKQLAFPVNTNAAEIRNSQEVRKISVNMTQPDRNKEDELRLISEESEINN